MNLNAFIDAALEEDLGPGDLTTESTVPKGRWGTGTVYAKQDLVLCGQEVAKLVFERAALRLGGEAVYTPMLEDGARVERKTPVAAVAGDLRTLLTAERLALNLLMKLSGIATNTARHVAAAGEGGPAIVDTRKTTPLLRSLEKLAVKAGGGRNHRHALYDGVLIKDNHIVAAGGIEAAVTGARAHAHHLVRIEIEVESLPQVEEAARLGVDVLLLDNMDDATLAEAVRRARAIDPRIKLEASGNMNVERIERIRAFGLDFISVGGLIHQATWADLSLEIEQAHD